jgi:hypothetical protein
MVKSLDQQKQTVDCAAFHQIEIARAWTWGAKFNPGAPQAPGGRSQEVGASFRIKMTDLEVHSSGGSIAFGVFVRF